MNELTHSQFLAILTARNGAAIVGIEALTDARALKTKNPFPEKTILKQVRAVGFVGASYEKAVQREGERQGVDASDFVAASLPWGEWLKGFENKVIAHKGALYLRTQTTPGQRKRQAARLLCYRDIHGQFIAKEEAQAFLPKQLGSARQAAAGVGSEDTQAEQIMVRTYAFSSIRKVRVNGQTFTLKAD